MRRTRCSRSPSRSSTDTDPATRQRRNEMNLSRDAIVEGLQRLLGAEHVITDEQVLRERSIDNFRKLETIFGVWTLPPPAAVARVGSAEEAAAVLAFAAEHGINVV